MNVMSCLFFVAHATILLPIMKEAQLKQCSLSFRVTLMLSCGWDIQGSPGDKLWLRYWWEWSTPQGGSRSQSYVNQTKCIIIRHVIYIFILQYPKDYVNQISMFDMSMRTSPGRSYKFYTGTPVFQFGDGLSYTTFTYKWSASPTVEEAPVQYSKSGGLVISRESLRRAQIDYEVEVTNTGSRGGAVSVLAFMTSSVRYMHFCKRSIGI